MPRAPRLPNIVQPPPLVDGKEQNALCPKGCGTYLVFKPDAIGRLQERCPSCDGVSRRSVLHPSHQATQQALVPITHVTALPPVGSAQLRCQVCAKGVDGDRRFCADHSDVCSRCLQPIPMPAIGRRPAHHDECRTPSERNALLAKRDWNDAQRAKRSASA